ATRSSSACVALISMRFIVASSRASARDDAGAFASGYRKRYGRGDQVLPQVATATLRAPVLLQVFQRFDTTAGRGSACLV
ncbi:MAG: hypothetical protein ABIP11_08140, partial [Luteimonas sp.]